jgi:hypothetical protein
MRVIDLGDAERRFLPELVFRPIGTAYNYVPSAGTTAKGHKLNVVDTAGLTDADWAAVIRVNRAYEAGGIEAFWGRAR